VQRDDNTHVRVVSTFTTIRDVARSPYGLARPLAGSGFDSLRRVRGVHVPLLVAHGDEDGSCQIRSARLGRRRRRTKRFLHLPGAHETLLDLALVWDGPR